MKYVIMQLPLSNPAKFIGLDNVKRNGDMPSREDYVRVYEGDIYPVGEMEDMLNDIFEILNVDHPSDYHAHSLSVSDVVGLNVGIKCWEWEWYYVDSIGFKRIWEREDERI